MKVVAHPDSGSDTYDSASDDAADDARHVSLAEMKSFVLKVRNRAFWLCYPSTYVHSYTAGRAVESFLAITTTSSLRSSSTSSLNDGRLLPPNILLPSSTR